MIFQLLNKKRKGQMRAVDFVISLFLFLLMLSQLLLIIINIQSNINRTDVGTISYDDLDNFSRMILQESGTDDWGYLKNLPNNFGLATSHYYGYFALDAAKIARLISGTGISTISGMNNYDYETLKDVIKLSGKREFQISLQQSLKISLTLISVNQTHNRVEFVVTNPYNTPIPKANSKVIVVNLKDAQLLYGEDLLTNSTGGSSYTYEIPHFNDPDGQHVILVVAETGVLWGVNWGSIDSVFPQAFIGSSSSTTIWAGGINSSALLVSDTLPTTDTPVNHFISIIYKDTLHSYSSHFLDLGSISWDGNETILLPETGLVILLSISQYTDYYRVGIGTYPAILDKTEEQGQYYNTLGHISDNIRIKALLSKTYPVIVRGLLMRCQITLWSE
ncbi:hypothetical protein [Candidatus Hodarchaeum mangrovi]